MIFATVKLSRRKLAQFVAQGLSENSKHLKLPSNSIDSLWSRGPGGGANYGKGPYRKNHRGSTGLAKAAVSRERMPQQIGAQRIDLLIRLCRSIEPVGFNSFASVVGVQEHEPASQYVRRGVQLITYTAAAGLAQDLADGLVLFIMADRLH